MALTGRVALKLLEPLRMLEVDWKARWAVRKRHVYLKEECFFLTGIRAEILYRSVHCEQ